jgi:hypothetical protein
MMPLRVGAGELTARCAVFEYHLNGNEAARLQIGRYFRPPSHFEGLT